MKHKAYLFPFEGMLGPLLADVVSMFIFCNVSPEYVYLEKKMI